ncbi:MAG: hypothetical protein JXA77_05940 [Bacteroidales bacterium]|nr:hypothetical protein [Bacteroidales bacterium]MBN2820579.1 hypothetical protein [Bacteroidales bacterium]
MRTLVIVKSDIKNIFRDKSLAFVIFVPFIFLALLRIAPPVYEQYAPVMELYRAHILSVFCLISTALMGFVLSFILLEEKDQSLFPVFQVLPLPIGRLLLLRTLVIMIYGFLASLLLIFGTGLVDFGISKSILLALSCSLTGPSSTFIITSFARNKIEGVTFFKLLNTVLMLPVTGVFIKSKLGLLFGIFPHYWIFSSFVNQGFIPTNLVILISLIANSILLYLSYLLFIRKTYQ